MLHLSLPESLVLQLFQSCQSFILLFKKLFLFCNFLSFSFYLQFFNFGQDPFVTLIHQ